MSFTAFPPSPTINTLASKGELLTHNGSSDASLAPSLTDGQVLTVDTAEATGIKWASLPSAGLPAGATVPFGGTTAPTGYLICDGSLLDRTVYADLFAAIGTNFGAGDGSTTFAIPDLRGRFIRGRANGSGLDPDRASRGAQSSGGNTGDNVGSVQSDGAANHTHAGPNHRHASGLRTTTTTYPYGSVDIGGGSGRGPNTENFARYVAYTDYQSGTTGGASNGGNETRPENIYFNYIIKY